MAINMLAGFTTILLYYYTTILRFYNYYVHYITAAKPLVARRVAIDLLEGLTTILLYYYTATLRDYVTTTQRQYNTTTLLYYCTMLTGPSECLVIADEKASPKIVAADLLAQAEHDPSALPALICLSESFAAAVDAEVTVATIHDAPTTTPTASPSPPSG